MTAAARPSQQARPARRGDLCRPAAAGAAGIVLVLATIFPIGGNPKEKPGGIFVARQVRSYENRPHGRFDSGFARCGRSLRRAGAVIALFLIARSVCALMRPLHKILLAGLFVLWVFLRWMGMRP